MLCSENHKTLNNSEKSKQNVTAKAEIYLFLFQDNCHMIPAVQKANTDENTTCNSFSNLLNSIVLIFFFCFVFFDMDHF